MAPLMSVSEIQDVQDVWAMVEPQRIHHGVEILIRLFEKYPETKAKFPRFHITDPEKMRRSPRIKAHAGRVVSSLGSLVMMLDDEELLDETLMLLGDSHNERKAEKQDFVKFFDVFMEYLKETLGDKFSESAQEAYEKFVTIFNDKIGETLQS